MGLFRRRAEAPPETGAGTSLPVAFVDGQVTSLVTWTPDRRRALRVGDQALRVLRAAGVRGTADVRVSSVDGGADVEVTLRNGAPLRLVVDGLGIGAHVVAERDRDDHDDVGYLHAGPEPLGAEEALGEVAFAVSTLVSHEGGGPGLPAPLTPNRGSVQLLPASGALPARWCVCVFVTRAHEAAPDADDAAREALWVEHSVGVKLHLDGSVARDPDDDDPDGDRSRQGLATAAEWAGGPVDLLPYATWLAAETQRRLDLDIPGLAAAPGR